jgi:CRISPR-associated endonuclease/helicase Cas3
MPAPRKKVASPPPVAIEHEVCWAKTTVDGRPGINVRDHCLNVGCVAEALISLLPRFLRDWTPAGVSTLAALHDIGKVSPGFQAKCENWLVQNGLRDMAGGWIAGHEGDHAKIGQGTVQKLLQNAPMGRWATVIGASGRGSVSGSLDPTQRRTGRIRRRRR